MRAAALLLVALSLPTVAGAVELPPTCAVDPEAPDETTPIAELRRRVEAMAETDPTGAVRLLCATIPRVERERGADSPDLAWWLGSLATPLIAYLDKNDEAIPLLDAARGILERKLGPDAEELADIHVAWAWIRFRQGRLAESKEAWSEALRIRTLHPGTKKVELQKVLVGLSQVALSQRDFAGARESLEKARAICDEYGEGVSDAAAAIENALTNLYLREEDYASARVHAEAQLDIESKLAPGKAQLVTGWALLGNILERLDEFEEAEHALREAVRLSEAADGPLQRHRLAALTNLGFLLLERGKPAEAADLEERALDLGERTLGPDAPTLVRILNGVAGAYRALGRLPEALHAYERAEAIVAAHPDDVERQVLVAFRRGLGTLALDLGETDRARATLERGLSEAGDDPTLATERAGLLRALAEISRGSDDQASRRELEQARSLYLAKLPGSHPTVLRVVNDLCALSLGSGPAGPECDEAARRIDEAREVEPALRHAVYAVRSRAAEGRGDAEAAYSLATRALSAAAALGTPDPLWRANFRLATLLHARGERVLDVLFGKQAIAEIERMRGSFVGEDRRLDRDFLRDKIAVYRSVADWLMEAGRIDEGLEVLRLLKSEELYDFALRDAGAQDAARGVSLTDEERRLWERYTSTLAADDATGEEIARLTALRESGRLSTTERRRLDELLEGEAKAEAARADRIRAFLAGGGSAAPAPKEREIRAEGIERRARRIGKETALAWYLLGDAHLRVLIVAGGATQEVRIPLDAEALGREIGRFLDGIASRADVAAESRRLYDTIARPVDEAAARAGATRLTLWLDGPLRYLPFGALSDGKRYLLDKYAIEIDTGDTAERSSSPATARSVRGLGVTRGVAGFAPLPAVAGELCSIVRGPIVGLEETDPACPRPDEGGGSLPGEGFADEAFTEARLDSLLSGPRDFDVLHLGTHFRLRPGNALRSFLVLGDGGKLTLDRIGALDFTGIDLVTLSSCQTALGGAAGEDGREVEGLSALARRRGAREVVASLWRVEDKSTARLMGSMYRSIADGRGSLDVPGALRRAQLDLRSFADGDRRPYAHPYYWAGFVVSGSPR